MVGFVLNDKIVGDVEVSGIGLIEVLTQHLTGEIEGNHEALKSR
jgi:hypothetical protein